MIAAHHGWAHLLADDLLATTGPDDAARTVVWVPTLAARSAVVRALLEAGWQGVLPKVLVPMADPVAMLPFGLGRELWAEDADLWTARQVVAEALSRADESLSGAALARATACVLQLLEDLALAGRPYGDLWASVPDDVAQHFMEAAAVLRVAVEDYEAWVAGGRVDVAALAAARWRRLAHLKGWREVVVPLGWQAKVMQDWLEAVVARGGNVIDLVADEPLGGPVVRRLVEAINPAAEARVVREAAVRAVRAGATPVAIAVGDSTLGELIVNELAAANLTPKGGWGRSVADTPAGRLAVALTAAAGAPGGLAYAAVGAAWLAIRPELATGLSSLEKHVWRGLGARSGTGWARRVTRVAERMPEVAEVATPLLASEALTAPGAATLQDWARWLECAMRALVGEPMDAVEGWAVVARLLADWAKVDGWLVPAGTMAAWLTQALDAVAAGQAVPTEAPVLTGRLAVLAGAKTLIVAGMNSAQWVPVRPHPWLSERQLVKLGIPGNGAAMALANAEWPLLWDGLGAEVVLASRSKHGFDGTEMAPAAPWQAVIASGQAVDKPAPAGRVAVTAPAPAALRVLDVATLSPSMIEDALTCPYRAAVGRRAEVRPWDDFDALPDARALGLMLHEVIAAYWADKMSRDGTPGEGWLQEDERAAANAALLALCEAALGREDDALAALWRPRVQALVPELIDLWIAEGAAGWRVAGVETELMGTVGGVAVRAVADLVETDPAGALRVVDYKTGKVPSQVEVRDGGKPQLAVEGAVLAAGGKAVAGLRFVRLRGFGARKLEHMDVADAEAAVAAVPDGLQRLAERLQAPWPAVPDLSKGGLEAAGHCARCAFAGWCRFEERGGARLTPVEGGGAHVGD